MQSHFTDPKDVWNRIPEHHKKTIRDKKQHVYFVDMVQIAREVASVADLEMRMQGIVLLGVFLRVTPFTSESGISDEALFTGVEKAIRKYFGKRGERVVQDNLQAVRRGYNELMEISKEVMLANPGKSQVATS